MKEGKRVATAYIPLLQAPRSTSLVGVAGSGSAGLLAGKFHGLACTEQRRRWHSNDGWRKVWGSGTRERRKKPRGSRDGNMATMAGGGRGCGCGGGDDACEWRRIARRRA